LARSLAVGEAHRASPNSFNLTAGGEVPRRRGEACPVRLGTAHQDPVRSLFVRLKDGMLLCETGTEDFDRAEIEATRGRQQIYVDASSKLFPDDFEQDLRKLRLADECAGCDARSRCGGCWHQQSGNVFAEDRRRVERILDGMTGRILDVGCGSAGYLRALEAAVAQKRVRYVGVEPDPVRLTVLRSRYPWASYRAGHAEDVLASGEAVERFRHVLLLRSYNHLPRPDDTLRAVWSLLEPGGTLLIVDNVVFGLVRRGDHAARAEAGPAIFEHFRNADSATLHEHVLAMGWRLLERHDVGPDGSNEWLLYYQKPESAS
jgi:SAM-dependent methyltransferase